MTLKFVEPGSLGIFFPPLTEKNDFFQETPVQSLEQEDAVHALIGECGYPLSRRTRSSFSGWGNR
jgi:hypothetical protein